METIDRIFKEPPSSYFLFGPRGTGKSTFLGMRHPDALRIDLLEPPVFRAMTARPEELRHMVDGNPGRKVVVIDEIQKVPALLDVVHQLIERRRGERFILTGSSARKLRRGCANMLAGRALRKTMHPFMAIELGRLFSLDSALELGMLPVVRFADDPGAALAAYISLYLKEEVQAEGLVRNLGAFARFLEAASFSHASVLNVSAIARECAVERKNVEGYLSILQDLLLSFQIPVFAKRAKRILASHAKFYYFDSGVYRSLRPKGPLDSPSEIGGAVLEGLVAQHLRAWIEYSESDASLSYWRTKAGVEVDFILYGADVFTAIEVKNSARVDPTDLRGLRSFKEDYPEADLIMLYRGSERKRVDGIWCIPCGGFLSSLEPGLPLKTGGG